ncbi:MAG: PspC domain-containing protein [Bacillota bacterium]
MRERLYRSRKDKMIAGVAGGLAEYFNIDPVIVRVCFVAAAILSGGLGIPVYILLWIVVPYKDQIYATATGTGTNAPEEPIGSEPAGDVPVEDRPRRNGHIWGYILIALGCLFLADRFIPDFDASEFWPLLLIALGAGLLLKGSRR